MNSTILRAENVTKVFRDRSASQGLKSRNFNAVDSVNLDIPRGKVYGLVGESGSGKTTLARCLLHLDPPTSGEVVFDGHRLRGTNRSDMRHLRHRMQIIFQDPNNALNPKISVYRSMCEGLSNRGIRGSEMDRKIAELTEMVSIPFGNLKRKPADFSGGQRQRLVIARALSMDPDFLVLDEPVSNLDVSIQAQIVNLLMELKDALNLTYLFISHDLNLVSYVSDMVGVMYAGQLVECGPVKTVLEQPLHGYTRLLLSSAPHLTADVVPKDDSSFLPLSPAAERGERGRGPGCSFRDQCLYEKESCGKPSQGMIDVGGGHLVACEHAADS
ncbi:MAG: ABC transporter ATP-binding protein [Spirochaetales bacterium]|jgi:peptide/nickel transport system ATP-binding protein|nr:ABC transporter ATP-binding protein [Spirochaetales bacterium]